MNFSKSQSAGYLANHMARLFAAGLQRRIAPLGLAPAQFMVLLELWQKDGQTQSELTAKLDVEQATMANTLARMQRDGLIDRTPKDTDRRAKSVGLTQKARDMKQAATMAAMHQNEVALARLSEKDKATLIDLMQKVIAGMQRASG